MDESELRLFRQFRATGSYAIRETLIGQYLPLVHSVARRFANMGETLSDLVQEGAIGLMKAVEHYDPEFGVKFITYATHIITSQIQHYLRDRGRLIRQPAWVQELNARLNKTVKRLATTLHREPSIEEIAHEMNLTDDSVQEILTAQKLNHIVSLTAPRDGQETDDLLLIDRAKIRTSKHTTLRLPIEDRIVIEEAINTLKTLEQRVVRLFFFGELNQAEIARKLGISHNYTSYLLHQSLAKLKHQLDTESDTEPMLEAGAAVTVDIPVYDQVTGCYSEAYLRARLSERIDRRRSAFALLVFALADVVSNAAPALSLVRHAGQVLTAHVQKLDLLAYLDGGNFALCYPHSEREARIFADRMRDHIQTSTTHQPKGSLILQTGIAAFPTDGDSVDSLFSHAFHNLRD